jgi:hypothetical protein
MVVRRHDGPCPRVLSNSALIPTGLGKAFLEEFHRRIFKFPIARIELLQDSFIARDEMRTCAAFGGSPGTV